MSIKISTLVCRSWKREMAASKRSHTKLEMIWIEILPPHFLGQIAEPLRNVANERIERPAGLGDQQAFIGQLKSARSAPAQSHAELGLEPFQRKTERGLLAPHGALRRG